jgi:hypothetical protein
MRAARPGAVVRPGAIRWTPSRSARELNRSKAPQSPPDLFAAADPIQGDSRELCDPSLNDA